MRAGQSNWLHQLSPEYFYAVMTLHGLGMVGLWFVAAMAVLNYVLTRYVSVSLWASRLAMALTVLGVGLLIACTLVGKFGAGWYFLYPLPLHPGGAWPAWSIGAFFAAIGVLGVGWLVWVLLEDALSRPRLDLASPRRAPDLGARRRMRGYAAAGLVVTAPAVAASASGTARRPSTRSAPAG